MIAYAQQQQTLTAPAPIEDHPVSRMAEAMREMAFNGQTVTADSLRLRGFTMAEIEKHGSEAADLATAQSVRRHS